MVYGISYHVIFVCGILDIDICVIVASIHYCMCKLYSVCVIVKVPQSV